MKVIVFRKTIIKAIAKEIAEYQRKADYFYYIRKDQDMSSFELERVSPLKYLSNRLGIAKEVYEEAYKIYDFRNSGKKDFEPNLEEIKSNKCRWGDDVLGYED
jgi:hypothetical protein